MDKNDNLNLEVLIGDTRTFEIHVPHLLNASSMTSRQERKHKETRRKKGRKL